jgi:hypothetical protein
MDAALPDSPAGRIADLADLPFSPGSALAHANARSVGAVLADRLDRL